MPEGSQLRAFQLFFHLLFGVRIPYVYLGIGSITLHTHPRVPSAIRAIASRRNAWYTRGMQRDQERARRAREAYERAQQEAARLAIEANRTQAAQQAAQHAAQESARIKEYLPRLTAAKDAALARVDATGYTGVQMITVIPARGKWVQHWFGPGSRYVEESPALEEPGWEVYGVTDRTADLGYLSTPAWIGGSSRSDRVYLLADGRFLRSWRVDGDMDGQHGGSGHVIISPEALVNLVDQVVEGVIAGLNSLGQPPAASSASGRP